MTSSFHWRTRIGNFNFPTCVAPIPTPTPCSTTTLLNEGFESATLNTFSSVVLNCKPGGCGWHAVTTAFNTGGFSAFAPDVGDLSDQQLTLTSAIPIPLTAPNADLTFWHRFGFDSNDDGAVLETSIDDGATWQDAGPYITVGGYNGRIGGFFHNPLEGRAGLGREPQRHELCSGTRSIYCHLPGRTCASGSAKAPTFGTGPVVGGWTTLSSQ